MRCGIYGKIFLVVGALACFSFPVLSHAYTGEPNNRVTINMGDTPWKFSRGDFFTANPSAKDAGFSDASWSDVGIPHCVNDKDSWLNFQTGLHSSTYKGLFWYRKRFTLDAAYAGRRIELEFQGVNIGCAVYINGTFKPNIHKVSQPGQVTHVNGHLPFVVDITSDVKFGQENLIAVRASNNTGGSGFFEPANIGDFIGFGMGFGGMHRPVYLHITDKVHVPLNVYSNIRRWGTYVGTTAATTASATVRLQTNVYNDDAQSKSVTVITKIVDAQNNVASTQTSTAQTISANSNFVFDQTATLANPKLWSPNNTPGGTPHLYRVYHIVQVGGQTVDVFRSPLGIRMITWDKDNGYVNGKKHMFWGFGSRYEYPGFGSAVPEEQQWRDIKLIADCGGSLLRPGHVPISSVTLEACDAFGVFLFENTMDNEWSIKDNPTILAYKDEYHRDCIIRDRNHPSLGVWELTNGSKHTNNTGFQVPNGWIKKMVDTIKVYDHFLPRAASSRDWSDYFPAPSELILGSVYMFRRHDPRLPAWGAESWMKSNARFSYDWEVEHTDRYIQDMNEVISNNGIGCAHWMFMECGGESYAKFGDLSITEAQRKTLGASAVDHNRIPKHIYHVYKNALWVPYAIRPGVTLQSHWNYSGGNRTVTAYSNCPSVELFVNNVSKGVKTPAAKTTKCEWTNVAWESGTLRAVGRNAAGQQVCADERKTAGAPSKILLTVEPAIVRPDNGAAFKVRANGTDAAFILATIVDAAGNWCPLATNNITFSVSGQGKYVGSSNYLANTSQGVSYHAPGHEELAAEGGMMKIGVRATYTPGSFTVQARAAGLSEATATVTTTDPKVAIRPLGAAIQPSLMGVGSKSYKVVGGMFNIPREFSGKTVSVKVYNLSGKLLQEAVVKGKNRFSLRSQGISAAGTFIVRCREIVSAR